MGRRRRIDAVKIATSWFDSLCRAAGVSRGPISQTRITRNHKSDSRSFFNAPLFFAANSFREYAALAS